MRRRRLATLGLDVIEEGGSLATRAGKGGHKGGLGSGGGCADRESEARAREESIESAVFASGST